MANKNNDGGNYPDISDIFKIDESSLPSNSVVMKNDKKKKIKPDERILTAPVDITGLPKEEQKKIRTEQKKQIKEKKRKKLKTRAILILSLIVILLAGLLTLKIVSDYKKKPLITVEKAVTDTISRFCTADATVIKSSVTTQAILIDNDYDVHFIEKKQSAEVTAPDGTVLTGTVSKIQEEKTNGKLFGRLTSALLTETPEVSVYTVYVDVDDPDGILKDSDRVSVKIITKTVKNAVLVQVDAICSDDGGNFVWLFNPVKKIITRQAVTVGVTADGKAEITAGLVKGDKVTVSTSCAADELYDGMKVKIK